MKRHHHTCVLCAHRTDSLGQTHTDKQRDKQKKHPQDSTIIIGKRPNQKHQKKDNHQHTHYNYPLPSHLFLPFFYSFVIA